jgi:hypothetical protein
MPGFIVIFVVETDDSEERQREGNDKVWFVSFLI